MPAPAPTRARDRLVAIAGVVLVQTLLGAALLIGLRIDRLKKSEIVPRLIDVTIIPPLPPRQPPSLVRQEAKHSAAAAPKAALKVIGGTRGPRPSRALPAPRPIVALAPTAPASGGGAGTGPALGNGSGGGTGGHGFGEDDEGGTDLVQIAGEIRPSDYPRDLRDRNIGGRVEMVFTVATNGRVTSCRVTRSSGVPELDNLTCRLIGERFRYRPSTDRYGRPIADEVEGEHDWIPGRR